MFWLLWILAKWKVKPKLNQGLLNLQHFCKILLAAAKLLLPNKTYFGYNAKKKGLKQSSNSKNEKRKNSVEVKHEEAYCYEILSFSFVQKTNNCSSVKGYENVIGKCIQWFFYFLCFFCFSSTNFSCYCCCWCFIFYNLYYVEI